ncbi:UNVERIFIED_CONTAM: hypothetical protein ABID98_005171 [Brevibacillus sp. OAP136]
MKKRRETASSFVSKEPPAGLPIGKHLNQSDKACSCGMLSFLASCLIHENKNIDATTAIATPIVPNQVIDDNDTRSTARPPIPAPAAIDNCIIDWLSPSMTPEYLGSIRIKLYCCVGPDDHAANDHNTRTTTMTTKELFRETATTDNNRKAAMCKSIPPISVKETPHLKRWSLCFFTQSLCIPSAQGYNFYDGKGKERTSCHTTYY